MTSKTERWFAADPEGLRLILERRCGATGSGGMEFALFELYANAADTAATEVTIILKPVPGKPLCELSVVDNDPKGFLDLKHAYTLFAESPKKDDPTKSGRFDLGEKLVLAFCTHAQITSTTGSVYFDASGERWQNPREKIAVGTRFWGELRMTREQYVATSAAVRRLRVRARLKVVFNGDALGHETPLETFEATLTTEIGGAGEPLRRTSRKTEVRVYTCAPGREAWLYELGIPVVSLGDDAWDVEVQQRVPLNIERDNVTPAFLRELRVAVLNAMGPMLTAETATAAWVTEAAGHPRSSDAAVHRVMDLRYGTARVGADPSDREAERTAASKGDVVVQQQSMPQELRDRVKAAGALPPAGRMHPTPRPYSDDPDAPPVKLLDPAAWTPGVYRLSAYVQTVGPKLLAEYGVADVEVVIANDRRLQHSATFGRQKGHPKRRTVTFNVARLGLGWFDLPLLDVTVNELVIHELAHECGHHLEASYHDACCRIGAKLARLVREKPELFC